MQAKQTEHAKAMDKYLDKLPRNIPITAKRIAKCASIKEGIPIKTVTRYMHKLVGTGEWQSIQCYSSDGIMAYIRVPKEETQE